MMVIVFLQIKREAASKRDASFFKEAVFAFETASLWLKPKLRDTLFGVYH